MKNSKKLMSNNQYRTILLLLGTFIMVVLMLNLTSAFALTGTRMENYTGADDSNNYVHDTQWIRQNITIGTGGLNSTFSLTGISLYLDKTGTPVNLNVSIFSVNSTDGMVSAIASNDTFNVATVTGAGWYNFTFPQSPTITAGQKYFIVLSANAGNAGNAISWRAKTVGGYDGGSESYSLTDGASWVDLPTYDGLFILYGNINFNQITISLDSPNNEVLSTIGTNFNASYSVINFNMTNVTYYVWNSTGSLFNSTFMNVTGNSSNSTSIFIDSFVLGDYYWNAKLCVRNSTSTKCEFSSVNNSFSVGATINSFSFSNTTLETKSETFSISINLLNNTQISLAQFIYNGTTYVVSDVVSSSGSATLSKTIDIPINNLNFSTQRNSFYWKFTYNGGQVQSLPVNYQNVSYINLQICDGTYSTRGINFTFVDELTNATINSLTNPTNIFLNMYYWIGSGNTKKQFYFQSLSSSVSNYSLCLYPNYTMKMDMDMQYSANTYSDRTYVFRNTNFSNATTLIPLYLLLSTEATKFTITLKQGTELVSGSVIEIWKYFVGQGGYVRTFSGITDDKGTLSANLDLDQNYKFIISKDSTSYGEQIKQATCSASPCTVDLNIGDISLSSFDNFYNYFAQNVNYTLYDNKTSKIVTLDFLDKLGTANYWRLYVYKTNLENDTIINICDTKSYAVSGTITCNYTGVYGDIVAKVYISRSPEKLVDFITIVNENASTILGESGLFASIIIILVIVFTGVRNPTIALVLLPFALIILKFIGFLPLEWKWLAGFVIFDIWIITRLKT